MRLFEHAHEHEHDYDDEYEEQDDYEKGVSLRRASAGQSSRP